MKPQGVKITLERADNGILLLWHDPANNMERHLEVFTTSGALLNRIDSLLDVFELDLPKPGIQIPVLGIEPPAGSPDAVVDALLIGPPGEE